MAETASVARGPNAEKPVRHDISGEFGYEPKYININGARLRYFDEGHGDPIIFIHGIPVWSYVWRNVMPHLEKDARVIALDLPGFGGSERGPAGQPVKTLVDHERYFEAFVDKLGLKNITLVIHDLGGGVGLIYAGRHPGNVRAIAFGETPIGEAYSEEPLPGMIFPTKASAGTVDFFSAMHDDNVRTKLVIEDNMFFANENFLFGIPRQLTVEEIEAYTEPFATAESRYAIADVVAGLTIDGEPRDNYVEIGAGLRWLVVSDVPKLHFQLTDGNLIDAELADQLRAKVRNLRTVELGEGRHFFQESHPHIIGRNLRTWFVEVVGIQETKH